MKLFVALIVFVSVNVNLALAYGQKIVGGQEARVGAYPWMVAIVDGSSSNAWYGQFCGGALIRPDWVLTASHCVAGKTASDLDLVIGRHKLAEGTVGERINAKKIISHENFSSETIVNDIALIQLERPSTYTPIDTLDLSTEDLANPGVLAMVIGYGTLREGAWSTPGKLYEVAVPIVTNLACQEAYGAENIVDTMMCAGYAEGGKDSCQGDSGGPFIVFDSGKVPHLAGVVSWGNGCARPKFYGVYTRVSDYTDWIQTNINKE